MAYVRPGTDAIIVVPEEIRRRIIAPYQPLPPDYSARVAGITLGRNTSALTVRGRARARGSRSADRTNKWLLLYDADCR